MCLWQGLAKWLRNTKHAKVGRIKHQAQNSIPDEFSVLMSKTLCCSSSNIIFFLILGKCHDSVSYSLQPCRVCLGCYVTLAARKGRTEVTCSGFSPPLAYICIFYVFFASFARFHEGYRKFELNNWSRIKCSMYNYKMTGRFEGRHYCFQFNKQKI